MRLTYSNVSLGALGAAFIALAFADLSVSALAPWAEMKRLVQGLMRPDFLAVEIRSVIWTVCFAVLGVSLGAGAGLAMAVLYPHASLVRLAATVLRSLHEVFWALLLIQITGLGPTTGILAIALPYAGIFAKVFSEMIEEADLAAVRVLPAGTSRVSAFAFARVPELIIPFRDYLLYRLECGLRSTLVLGFIGLPTLGFHLESYFKQGNYAQAAALLFTFYLLIGTRRLWARASTLPLLLPFAVLFLPEGIGGGSTAANLVRFAGEMIPAPLRGADFATAAVWHDLAAWLGQVVGGQALPGVVATLVLSQITIAATAVLGLAAFPFVSSRFSGRCGRLLGRVVLLIVRSTPEYMLAYVLLQTLGPSMLPAILALSIHNGCIIAYLMGRRADTLAYRPDAPRGLDLYAYEAVPRLYGQFLAFVLYRWEIIVRESAIFGILGVATLGFYVDAALSELRFDRTLVLLLAMIALSTGLDLLSRRLRAALRITTLPVRLSIAR